MLWIKYPVLGECVTVLLVHLFNLPRVPASLDDIVVKFKPER